MRAYILTDQNFRELLIAIDRNPEYGVGGGTSRVLSEEERKMFQEVHGFYNYLIRKWVDEMKEES